MLAATDERYQHSREQCVKYAKRILAIYTTPGCSLAWARCALEKHPLIRGHADLSAASVANSHHIKVISAAVALALELLQSPTEADAPIIRNLIDATLRQAEGYNTASVRFSCSVAQGIELSQISVTVNLPQRNRSCALSSAEN